MSDEDFISTLCLAILLNGEDGHFRRRDLPDGRIAVLMMGIAGNCQLQISKNAESFSTGYEAVF
jgi:hypothetical protein